MELKKHHIEELLNNIRNLESRVAAAADNETLSFSFFKDAFQRIQELMKLLHELEMQQIEDMKVQMEKLVQFLSETENNKKTAEAVTEVDSTSPEKEVVSADDSVLMEEESTESPMVDESREKKRYNPLAEGVALPIYINPEEKDRPKTVTPPPSPEKSLNVTTTSTISEMENTPSLNDLHQVSTAPIEVKRSLSLNDRFFYQRELFDNNREAMSAVMNELNKLQTMEEVEEYLRENRSWDFENEHVKSFLELLGKTES